MVPSTDQARRRRQESPASSHRPNSINYVRTAMHPTESAQTPTTLASIPISSGVLGGPSKSLPLAGVLQASSQPQAVRAEAGNEDLRAQVKSLQYEVESLKQERDLTNLRYEKELRDVQGRAEGDFKRALASESSKHKVNDKYAKLVKELDDFQDRSTIQQHEMEKKLRTAQEQKRSLQEIVDEVQTQLSTLDRRHTYQLIEVETKCMTLQKTLNDVRDELCNAISTSKSTQDRLNVREAEVGRLESELLQLKTQSLEFDDLATVKRELSEQISHMRKLERTNRKQSIELRYLRQAHKAVEIAEEEKKALEIRVQSMEDLRRELDEVQLQRRMLEDERSSWVTYLEGDNSVEFDSPVAVARALAHERLENASLVESLGAVQPELSEKEALIESLEKERNKLQADLEKFRSGELSCDSRTKSRLERAKVLAFKEVEYLRQQLRTFESEDTARETSTGPEAHHRSRIQELESLVSQYRKELETVTKDPSKCEKQLVAPETQVRKRPHEEDSDERLGELSRKNRKLQSELTALQQTIMLLRCDFTAAKTKISILETEPRTRILSLRSNPTDNFTSEKYSTIASLRKESAALRTQLTTGSSLTKVVPISTLENVRLEVLELQTQVADKEKRMLRLRQIWSLKSLEFREAVASLLGWKVDSMPNGRFRVMSMFPSGGEEGGGENSLIFDGDTSSMKIGGGPDSDFALEIKGLIKFWVEERNMIPGLLAAMTLEFYERTTRTQKR